MMYIIIFTISFFLIFVYFKKCTLVLSVEAVAVKRFLLMLKDSASLKTNVIH